MSTFGFGIGLFITRTKRAADQLSLGPTVWVELSLGLNVGGLNVKASYLDLFHIHCKKKLSSDDDINSTWIIVFPILQPCA